MTGAVPWGHPCLFSAAHEPVEERFRVRVAGGAFGPVLSNLAIATAQARAAALGGVDAEIVSLDGTSARVEWAGDRFVVTSRGPASWPHRCCRLLVEHG
jgi:hypothetical protein